MKTAEDTVPTTAGWSRRSDVLAALGIVIGSMLIVGLHVRAYSEISPIDEFAHIDYLHRVSEGSIPHQGDLLRQDTMREVACRGIDSSTFEDPPCHPTERYTPAEFQYIRENQAAHHSPLYYGLTAVGGGLVRSLTGTDDFIDSSRLAGGFWLAAGLLLLLRCCRRIGVSLAPSLAVVGLLGSTPAVVHAAATVNNDASMLAGGGLVAFVALRWEDEGGSLWPLALVGGVVALLKVTAVLAVAAGGIYLAIRGFASEDASSAQRRKRYLFAAGALAVGAATAILGWLVVHRMVAEVPTSYVNRVLQSEGLQLGQVLNEGFALVSPIAEPHRPSLLAAGEITASIGLTNALLIAASFGAFLGAIGRPRARGWGMAAATAMLIGGFGLPVTNYLFFDVVFTIPPRYGLALVPMLGIPLAAGPRSPVVIRFLTALGVLSVLVLLLALVRGVA